jgi:hypothetical protein
MGRDDHDQGGRVLSPLHGRGRGAERIPRLDPFVPGQAQAHCHELVTGRENSLPRLWGLLFQVITFQVAEHLVEWPKALVEERRRRSANRLSDRGDHGAGGVERIPPDVTIVEYGFALPCDVTGGPRSQDERPNSILSNPSNVDPESHVKRSEVIPEVSLDRLEPHGIGQLPTTLMMPLSVPVEFRAP